MISVKKAAIIATTHFTELFGGIHHKIAIEETEISNNEKFWYITIGYDLEISSSPLSPFGTARREFKRIKINAESGQVLSMKIRKVE